MPSNLKSVSKSIKRAAVRGLDQGAEAVAMRAKGHAPVRSGRLQSEIAVVPAQGEGSHYEASVISPTPYALQQEVTGGVTPTGGVYPPHPYLRPALHESRSEVSRLVRASVRSAIRGKKVEERVEI